MGGTGGDVSEWIESHSSLPRHRKTRRLAAELGISVPLAVGLLHMLWYYALDFAPGGDLTDHSAGDIADGCGWDGAPELFVQALVVSGWLSDRDGLMVHDWEDYNQSHRKRAAEAERQRRKRSKERDAARQAANPLADGAWTTMSRAVTGTVTPVTPDRQTDRQTGQTGQTGQTEKSHARAREAATAPDDPVENPTVANLVILARRIPDWKPAKDDAAFMEVALQTYSPAQIQRTISELSIRQAASHEYKAMRTTLGNWLKRCVPEARAPSHQPFVPNGKAPTEAERAEVLAQVRAMTATIGRGMP